MEKGNTINAFFALVRAGLWEKEVKLLPYGSININVLYDLAEQQSVTGLVTAGLEHVVDVKLPQDVILSFVGQSLQLEQRNNAMNSFICTVIKRLHKESIDSILIKGQGIALCYERPLWRSSGDVDLLMDEINYQKGKKLLNEMSDTPLEENLYSKELITNIKGFCLELHGTIRGGLSRKMDKELDIIQTEICNKKRIRQWDNNGVLVSLPDVNNDILLIFTHFLKHYFKGGLGIRQICDWCRLMWTYKDDIDVVLLEKRLCSMRLMAEWKAFAAFAVHILGMPIEAMPLLSQDDCHNANLKKKAHRICKFIMEVGNFGHNRDMSFYREGSYWGQKVKSFGRRMGDLWNHLRIFPMDTLRFFPRIMWNGVVSAVRGE